MQRDKDHLLAKIGQYAIIQNDERKILVLQRTKSKTWSLPGGRLNRGEECHEALSREIKEETGLDVIELKPFDVNIITDPYQTKYCVYFKGKVSKYPQLTLSEEHCEYKWIGIKELNDLKIEYDSVKQILQNLFSSNQ